VIDQIMNRLQQQAWKEVKKNRVDNFDYHRFPSDKKHMEYQ
jgi:hypothetical protein